MGRGRLIAKRRSKVLLWEVIVMVKHDLLSGLLYGVVLGLFFSPQLVTHLPLIVILAILFGARMISLK